MRKILFVVLTHGNETAGLELFLKYPYGKNEHIEWEVVVANPEAAWLQQRFLEQDLNRICHSPGTSLEGRRAKLLKQKMSDFDVVYDIHTTSRIQQDVHDCVFINTLDSLPDTNHVQSLNVIYDSTNNEQYVTSLHPNGITLEYTKTGNVKNDRTRIFADFQSIIQQKMISTDKKLLEFNTLVSKKTALEYQLSWHNFEPISETDIASLKLKPGIYLPVFVNNSDQGADIYAALNRQIK